MDSVASHSALVTLALSLGASEEATDDFLRACTELRIAARVGERWLGLAVHDPPRWEEPAEAAAPHRHELVVLG